MNDRSVDRTSQSNYAVLRRLLAAILWSLILFGCANHTPLSSPPGVEVPVEDLEKLTNHYRSIQSSRQNELDFKIALPNVEVQDQEQVRILATLTNRSNKLVNIRKVSSLPIKGANLDNNKTSQVLYYITDKSTGETTDVINLLDFVDPGFPTVEAFLSLPSGERFTEELALPPLEKKLGVGKYQLQIRYVNYEFGGLAQKESSGDDYILDVSAWMGDILSNVVDFEIVKH